MSYTHVLCNRGAVHAVPDDGGEYTVCGKEVNYRYDEVTDPVSCKVCARSIELSRDHRIAREVTDRIKYLWLGIAESPDACLSWVSSEIAIIKAITEGE